MQDRLQYYIQNYSRLHINAVVASKGALPGWKFTGFYGHPDTAKRSESWDLLRHLNSFQPTLWLCLGDFNKIMDHSEKKGIVIRPKRQMNNFQRALEDARLGFKGPKFTWNNGRPGREFTLERLDRAMANMEWCNTWQEAGVEVMMCCSSDHLPLFLSMTKQVALGRKWRPFRYEVGWSKNGDVKKIIKEAWIERRPDVDPWKGFTGNIHKCRKALKQWVKKSKPVSERSIVEKTATLGKIQEEADPLSEQMEKQLKKDILDLLEQEELKWRQWAKEEWLRGGDRNTKYFHASASQRQRWNKIDNITDRLGRLCES
jgi:hypothetical protein